MAGREITGRKRAEESLRRERSLLDSIMRTTDVMLVLLDPHFNFLWVNPAYAASCGMKAEEMVGKNHFALYPHEENEAIFHKVRDTGEGVFYRDKPFVFPDQPERGTTYWDWSLTPIKDGAGNVASLVFSLRETTKFKQAEEALHESERRLALAASGTHIGMFDWNIATGEVLGTEQLSRLLALGRRRRRQRRRFPSHTIIVIGPSVSTRTTCVESRRKYNVALRAARLLRSNTGLYGPTTVCTGSSFVVSSSLTATGEPSGCSVSSWTSRSGSGPRERSSD